MFEINIKAQIAKFEKNVSAAAFKQIPFATAQALTALARQAAKAEKDNEAKVLDRPKPFTEGAIRVAGASPRRQSATVFMQDTTARYLEPYEFGGTNVLNSRAVLTPIGEVADSKLDQYGNLPRNFLKNLRGRSDIYIGPIKTKRGVINGVWQRAAGASGKATRTRITRKGKLVTKVAGYVPDSRSDRRLKLLLKFTDAHPVRQHLGWFVVAKRTVDRGFNREMGKALAKALATAR